MSQRTIVLCFPVEPEHVKQFSGNAESYGFEVLVSGQETIGEDISRADIFCGHAKQNQINWPEIVAAGRLKWIQSTAAGLDHCLHPSVVESKIMVSGCSGLFARQVGEQTLALLFGMLRRLPVFFRAQQTREYVRRPTDQIDGKTIGIIGFGGNGQRIAEILKPFDTPIIATDCFANELSVDGVELLPADALLYMAARSDILIATLPLTPVTDRLLGNDFFSALKSGSYFVNVGRGSTVEQTSLIRHLRNGHLLGAGLDVADPEPLPAESPLWAMENVIITPHVGAQSRFRVPMTVELFCENLDRFLGNRTLFNLVDKQLGFPRPENRLSSSSLN